MVDRLCDPLAEEIDLEAAAAQAGDVVVSGDDLLLGLAAGGNVATAADFVFDEHGHRLSWSRSAKP